MSPEPAAGGRVFREAALRAHLAGRAATDVTAADGPGPGRVLIGLWVAALALIALAALVVT